MNKNQCFQIEMESAPAERSASIQSSVPIDGNKNSRRCITDGCQGVYSGDLIAGHAAARPARQIRYAAAAVGDATNGSRYRLRTGCCSFATALASICRTRSRVTLKIRPTSSSVYE